MTRVIPILLAVCLLFTAESSACGLAGNRIRANRPVLKMALRVVSAPVRVVKRVRQRRMAQIKSFGSNDLITVQTACAPAACSPAANN